MIFSPMTNKQTNKQTEVLPYFISFGDNHLAEEDVDWILQYCFLLLVLIPPKSKSFFDG